MGGGGGGGAGFRIRSIRKVGEGGGGGGSVSGPRYEKGGGQSTSGPIRKGGGGDNSLQVRYEKWRRGGTVHSPLQVRCLCFAHRKYVIVNNKRLQFWPRGVLKHPEHPPPPPPPPATAVSQKIKFGCVEGLKHVRNNSITSSAIFETTAGMKEAN